MATSSALLVQLLSQNEETGALAVDANNPIPGIPGVTRSRMLGH